MTTVSTANATNKVVTWSSNNPKVATVDKNGKVTAVGLGGVFIFIVVILQNISYNFKIK